MKTLIPLTVLAGLAALAITASASDKLITAGDVLLSPRAQGNQMKTVPGVNNSPNTVTQNQNVTASPRTLDNRIKVVKGGDSSPNTIAGGCALGSPRQLEEARKFTSGDCCKVTSVVCSTPKSCCAVASK